MTKAVLSHYAVSTPAAGSLHETLPWAGEAGPFTRCLQILLSHCARLHLCSYRDHFYLVSQSLDGAKSCLQGKAKTHKRKDLRLIPHSQSLVGFIVLEMLLLFLGHSLDAGSLSKQGSSIYPQ